MVGLAGVIVSVIGIAAACNTDKQSTAPSNSTVVQNQEITGNDNCIGQGTGNTIVCPPKARSFGNVTLESHKIITAFFAGPPDQLPVPPAYPVEATQGHCDEWREWLASDSRIYMTSPIFEIGMTAGHDDLVVVKDVRVEIFKRTPATPGTTIKCLYGGGSNAGVNVYVDTAAQRTTFQPFESDEVTEMPPGSLTLGQGDAGFSNAAVMVKSMDGFLYEGRLVVEAIVNNKPETIRWGSQQQPFRWLSDESGQFTAEYGKEWDWNPVTARWVQGLDPFNLNK